MALVAPTRPIWAIAVVLAVLGVLARLVALPVISVHPCWLVAAGFVVLLIGTTYKGL